MTYRELVEALENADMDLTAYRVGQAIAEVYGPRTKMVIEGAENGFDPE